jgi:hypothetical protein
LFEAAPALAANRANHAENVVDRYRRLHGHRPTCETVYADGEGKPPGDRAGVRRTAPLIYILMIVAGFGCALLLVICA